MGDTSIGKRTGSNFMGQYETSSQRDGTPTICSHTLKNQLSQFAKRTGIEVHVSHFPRGTSKWNKVEHCLFCYISKNWQGKPLISVEVAVNLIGSTTTTKGLKVICQRDDNIYERGKTVSDEEFEAISIEKIEPLNEWNYILKCV